MDEPYTDAEAAEAREWSNRHGPPNCWTAGNGTAARMIGRLLNERERLRSLTRFQDNVIRSGDVACLTQSEREALHHVVGDVADITGPVEDTIRGLLERLRAVLELRLPGVPGGPLTP